jgi:A/G-specific adenine glycosylase
VTRTGQIAGGGAIFGELAGWYAREKRQLPWRETRDAYAVWVSETMLQQTRVVTVLPYYERFLKELPDMRALAEAPEERVLALWSGLGYYRRARMLHAAARTVVTEHGGRVPQDPAALEGLAGVGRYTAAAVASIAFGKRAAVVDGNVARVLARLYAVTDDVKSARGSARVWAIADRLAADLPEAIHPGDWNQALMELGATVCLPGQPRCEACPVAARCEGRARGIAAELPRAKPKREPVATRRVSIVLASAQRVVLARRRKGTLFGGLWEPPSDDRRFLGRLAGRLGVDRRALEHAGDVVHVLSHRRMLVAVFALGIGTAARRRWLLLGVGAGAGPCPGPDYDAIEAVRIEDVAERAHATLTRKVLAAAGVLVPKHANGV